MIVHFSVLFGISISTAKASNSLPLTNRDIEPNQTKNWDLSLSASWEYVLLRDGMVGKLLLSFIS